MTEPARTRRILELYRRVAQAEPGRRDGILRAGAAGDEELASEVLEMMRLDRDGDADPFSENRIEAVRRTFDGVFAEGTADAPLLTGARVGSYVLARSIGEGATSLVYEAIQEHPHRHVALKLLHPSALDAERRARFQREVEALGRLQHPGIAQILTGGTVTVAGRPCPYLAMELVRGRDLLEYAEGEGLDRGARLELLARVADAIQHAHDHGVLHRDLKPANILVDQEGQPKVLDFGIARVADPLAPDDSGGHTRHGEILGTIAYMSPEQLAGDPASVSPRSDVYGLGVVLFQLLTGHLPIPLMGLSLAEAVEAARTADPVALGTLDPRLRGDVETVVGKALEKDPRRRYASASELAADLRRLRQHRAVAARPPSALYRARKLLRRHRGAAAAVLGLLVLLIAGIVLALAWADREHASAARATRRLYASTMSGANYALNLHDPIGARAQFERAPAELRGWEWHHVRARLESWIVAHQLPARAVGMPVFLADGRLALALEGGLVALYDPEQPDPELVLDAGLPLESMAAEQPSGRVVAAALGGPLVVWDLARCTRRTAEQSGQRAVAPDTASLSALLAQLEREERVQGSEKDEIVARLTEELDVLRPRRPLLSPDFRPWLPAAHHRRSGVQVTDPDPAAALEEPRRGWVALAVGQRAAWVLDAATWEIRHELQGHSGRVTGMAVTPDGRFALTASSDGTVRMWDTASWITIGAFETGFGDAYVAIDPSGRYFSVAAANGRGLRTWRLEPPGPRVLHGHDSYVYGLDVAPDGRTVASAGFWAHDPTVRLWDAATGQPVGRIPLRAAEGWIAFGGGGDRLVSVLERGSPPCAIDLATGATTSVGAASWVAAGAGTGPVAAPPAGPERASGGASEREPGGRGAAASATGEPAALAAASSGSAGSPMPPLFLGGTPGSGFRLRVSSGRAPEGDAGPFHLAASGLGSSSEGRLQEPAAQPDADVVPEPDARDSRSAGSSGPAAPSAAEVAARAEWMAALVRVAGPGPRGAGGVQARDVGVSREGRLAAWVTGRGRGGPADNSGFWAGGTGLEVVRFPGGAELARVALPVARECAPDFRPGGEQVAIGLADGRVAVWSWRRGGDPTFLVGHTDAVYAVRYSPDGTRLATGGNDNRVILWDATALERTIELTGHERYVHALEWSADGTQLVSASGDRTVRIWDSVTPAERHRRARTWSALERDVSARFRAHARAAGIGAALADPRWSPSERPAVRRAAWERIWGAP